MDIYQFQILNPIIDKKKPHIDKYGVFIIPKIMKNQNNYISILLLLQQFFKKLNI